LNDFEKNMKASHRAEKRLVSRSKYGAGGKDEHDKKQQWKLIWVDILGNSMEYYNVESVQGYRSGKSMRPAEVLYTRTADRRRFRYWYRFLLRRHHD